MTPTTNNQLQDTNADYVYDAAGNLTQPGPIGGPYVYDAENHLTSADGVTYTYDGDGNRIMKSNGTIYWYGANSDSLEESDLSGNLQRWYYFFDGQRVGRELTTNEVGFYMTDHLGSVRYLGGSSTGYSFDYFPFGGTIQNSDAGDDRYQFTAKERDSESGLDDLATRFYSSSLGRFTSADSYNIVLEKLKGQDAAEESEILSAYLLDPQNLNKYSYGLNNPIEYSDPDGRRAISPTDYADLQKLVDYAQANPQDAAATYSAINALIAAIQAVPDGANDPAGLSTALWAAGQVGNTSWGKPGAVSFSSNGFVVSAPAGTNKCNIFVAVAWAIGGGAGFGGSGVPATYRYGGLGQFTGGAANVPSAQALGNPNQVIPNFPSGSQLQVGSIIAFMMNDPNEAHAGIYLGGGAVAAAAGDMARVRGDSFLRAQKPDNPPNVRDHKP